MDTFFAGEIATELVKELIRVIRRVYLCRQSAEQLRHSVETLLPIVNEVRSSGVELPQARQKQLSDLVEHLRLGLDLARKAASSSRFNVYRSLQLARRMEKVESAINRWVQRQGEESDSDSADTVAAQVSRLAMEIRQLASARTITVVNAGSGEGNVTSFLVPAATLGAVGYGYMWWKGLSFSDLMYVTKRNMASAVSSMTKHLEQVTSALAATKRHLTQRIEGLDGKLDEQKLMSTEIRDEVTHVRGKLEKIGFNLSSIQQIVYTMDGKMNTIERKQAFLCAGILHLCNIFPDKDGKLRELMQEGPKPTTARGYLAPAESGNLKGLKHIMQALESGNLEKANLEGILSK